MASNWYFCFFLPHFLRVKYVCDARMKYEFCDYVLWPRSGSSLSPAGQTDVDAKSSCHSFRYSLDFPSMGHCIIINNKNFDRKTGTFHALMVGSGAAKFEIETPTELYLMLVLTGWNWWNVVTVWIWFSALFSYWIYSKSMLCFFPDASHVGFRLHFLVYWN